MKGVVLLRFGGERLPTPRVRGESISPHIVGGRCTSQALVLNERHLLADLLDDLHALPAAASGEHTPSSDDVGAVAHISQSGTLSHIVLRYGRSDLSIRLSSFFAVTKRLSIDCALSSLRAIAHTLLLSSCVSVAASSRLVCCVLGGLGGVARLRLPARCARSSLLVR